MPAKWYEIRAEAGSRSAELWIYDVIGVDFWGDGTSAAEFSKELAALDVDEIALHLNSPGGNFFDGVAIHAALQRHPAKVTAYVDGYAASAAWMIAQAADHIVMAQNAFQMFHKAYGVAIGNDEEIATYSRLLAKIDDQQTSTAMQRMSKTEDEFRASMAAGDTWLSASEAVEWGFADEVAEPVRAAALTSFDFKALGITSAPVLAAAGAEVDCGKVLKRTNLSVLACEIEIEEIEPAGTDDADNRDEGGSPGSVASEDAGGAPVARTEAFIEGIGYVHL